MARLNCTCNCRPKLKTPPPNGFSKTFISGHNFDHFNTAGYGINTEDVWTDGTDIYFSYGGTQKVLKNGKWEYKTWKGELEYFQGRYVWTDGKNIYYSDSSTRSYVLNGDTWENKSWTAPLNIYSLDVWTDGKYTYYNPTGSLTGYVFDGTSWNPKTWSGESRSGFNGRFVWTDGTNTYYSEYSTHYALNGGSWVKKTWYGDNTNFSGMDIWTDGTNTYCSTGTKSFILKGSTWEKIEFIGESYTDVNNEDIWYHKGKYYYSRGQFQYVLKDGIWEPKKWSGLQWSDDIRYGFKIWTDGTNIYYSEGSKHYILNDDEESWSVKDWGSLKPEEGGSGIWSDGVNTYYSYDTTHYILQDGAWKVTTWNGLSSFRGHRVWTDGSSIYHTANGVTHILNGNTWGAKTWSGNNIDNGYGIWTYNSNIYYSYGSTHYVLKNGVWENKTWNGNVPPTFYGAEVWIHSSGVYHSLWGATYKLTSGDTWVSHNYQFKLEDIDGSDVWNHNGNTYYDRNGAQYPNYVFSGGIWRKRNFYKAAQGSQVWTDGTNVYSSYRDGYNDYHHSVLVGDSWEEKTWEGFTEFEGIDVWRYNSNTYCTVDRAHYILKSGKWVQTSLNVNNYIPWPEHLWTDGNKVYYTNGAVTNNLVLYNGVWKYVKFNFSDDYYYPYPAATPSMYGAYVWSDGENIYYSEARHQLILKNGVWENHYWEGYSSNLDGRSIWTDGVNIYADASDYSKISFIQLTLRDGYPYWSPATFEGITPTDKPVGRLIWTDGTNIFYSPTTTGQEYYMLLPKNAKLYSKLGDDAGWQEIATLAE